MKNVEIFETSKAPAAIGPYAQAVRAGDLLFCSGQIPLDPVTGALVQGDASVQAGRVMENIAAVLSKAGLNFERVVKTTIFLTDLADFSAVNEVYGRYFPTHKPARSTVAVKGLPRGALVEIEAIAAF